MRHRHIAPTRRQNNNTDLTIIILAANIGYGMKSYGPKSLLNINDKETLLEYQLGLLQSTFSDAEIILVVGFEGDRIIRKRPPGIRIVENQLYETTNEVEQLRLALNCSLSSNVLIIKDDIVFNQDTLNSITKEKSCLIYDNNNQIDKNNIGVTVVNGQATTFSYDIDTKWCHILYLTSKEIKIIQTLCNRKDRSKMFLHEILNIILGRVGTMRAISPTGMEIVKINTSKQLFQLKDS